MPGEIMVDVRELQRRLKCGRSAAYGLIASQVLRSVRIGRSVRVPESVLDEFIQSGGVRVIPKGNGDAPTPPQVPAKMGRQVVKPHRKRALAGG
jgi:excisionase family DNA binding protein